MRPYYQDGSVTLYHGDARELLPAMEADTIVTDPVWPNAVAVLAGRDDPQGLLREVLDRAPVSVIRSAIRLDCDSDPRFGNYILDIPGEVMYIVCMEVGINAIHGTPVSAPEPGEYMVSEDVWVEAEQLTDGSLVFNVWMRSDAERVARNGKERVRFAVEPCREGDLATWTVANGLACDLAKLTRSFCGWGAYI